MDPVLVLDYMMAPNDPQGLDIWRSRERPFTVVQIDAIQNGLIILFRRLGPTASWERMRLRLFVARYEFVSDSDVAAIYVHAGGEN